MLEISSLVVRYAPGGPEALSEVSFTIGVGERVALVGANGAGKSTLLLTIMGVIKEESGAVVVDGETVGQDRIKTIRKTFGLLFQNPDDQVFMPTVREDVAFGPVNMGLSDGEIKVCVDEALRVLGIEHLSDRLTHALSGGEKRLVALAGNLAMRPETLLMDEPSSFLDPRSRRRLIDILKTLDQTMLIATHDLDLALDVCSRAIALKDGRVYADGPVERLLTDPALIEACGLEMPLTRQSR